MGRKESNPNPPKKKKDSDFRIDDISFGDKIEDQILGFKGIVTGIHHMFSGCTRWEFQQEKSKDNFYTDMPKLLKKFTGELKEMKPFKFKMGQVIKDVITGKKFVVTRQFQHITGYNRYYCRVVNPKKLGEFDEQVAFEENELLPSFYWLKFKKVKQINQAIEEVRTEKRINKSPALDNRRSSKF